MGFAVALTDGTRVGFTAIVIVFDVALVGFAHDRLDTISTVTRSPLVNVLLVNVAELLLGWLMLFIFQV